VDRDEVELGEASQQADELVALPAGAGVAGALDVEGRSQQRGPEVLLEEADLRPALVGDVVAGVEVELAAGLEAEDRPRLPRVGPRSG
jgi:hypothetical protein